MYKFADANGKEWTLRTSIAASRLVLAETGVNVYLLPQQRFEKLAELLGDPFKLLDVAWVLCRPSDLDGMPDGDEKTKALKSAKEAFEAAIDGPALEHLGAAVLEAIPDFFSDRPGQENLRSLFAKAKKVAVRMQAQEAAKVEAFDPEKFDLEKATQQPAPSGETSSNGPGSAESPQTT